MKTALATLAAAGLALSATAAQAETVHVTYDDLDLGSIAGQKVLSARIDRAARKVCGHDRAGTRNLRMDQMTRNCFNQAKAEAGKQFAARVSEQALGG
ncbi:UrcA family protein [Qipengyuania flava]|uniref:UrcA family protein n=1 Tax=Qipengyuania flava TaxID=192812 RepID=UPI00141A71CC|nr:UrcA family protein [Qipengyuania flava]NIJ62214.1 UrcA family protein [Qipengyuania flava]